MMPLRFGVISLGLALLTINTKCPPPPSWATASFSPGSLSFAAQVASPTNSASPSQTVTLTAGGSKALAISAMDVSGEFSETNDCPASLSPGQTCSIQVSFLPNSVGTITGAITLTSNASGSPHVISLSGTGLPPVGFAPAGLNFGSVSVNTTSSAQAITVTNNQSAALGISSIGVSGDYSQSNNCPSSLAAAQTCQIFVRFKPTMSGTIAGTLNVATDASPGTQPLGLTGKGAGSVSSHVTFSSGSLAFGNQEAGTASAQKSVTVTNTSGATLTIQSVGTSAGYASTNDCAGQVLAAGGSCTINVSFQPVADFTPVDYPGAITVVDSDSTSPQVVSLAGTGVAPITSSPASLDFGNVFINTTSAPQTVTMANNDAGDEGLSMTASGGFSLANNNCGSTLAPGATCTTDITFATNTFANNLSGPVNGALTLTPSSTGFPNPSVVSLKACATHVLVWPQHFNFGAVPLGSTGMETVIFYSPGSSFTTSAATVVGSNPGDFAISNNTCNGGSTSSCTMDITYAPTASGLRSATVSVTDDDGCSPHQQTLIGGSSTGPFTADVQVNSSTVDGTVTSTPSGINCDLNSTPCAATFPSGTAVTLSTTVVGGRLSGWSGDCSGTGSCLLDMTSDKEVTASFVPDPQLTVMISGSGNGIVSSSPTNIDCEVPITATTNCVSTFPYGTSVTLTAAPASGSSFAGWSGGGCSGNGTCTFTSTVDQTITATFNANVPADFTLSASPITPATIKAGQSAIATVAVSPAGGFNGTVSFSCSVKPSPAHAPTCSVTPSVSGASLTVMTIAPTLSRDSLSMPKWTYASWILLLGLMSSAASGKRKSSNAKLIIIASAILLALALQSACGGSSHQPSGGTPAGNYSIAVTGTSGALQHAVKYALTVQ